MVILLVLFLILALICFVLAAKQWSSPRVNLVALGLLFVTLYFLLPLLVSLTVGPHRHF